MIRNYEENDRPGTADHNKHVYSDTERQLFNVSLSVNHFLREARKDEKTSIISRRKCRNLMESGRILEARIAARKTLEARSRVYALSSVAKRIEWLLTKLNDDGFIKPELKNYLKMLDSAVLASDVWEAKKITNTMLEEIEKMETVEVNEKPTEKEITQYLKNMKNEIAIFNKIKHQSGYTPDASEDLTYFPDEFGDLSDSSTIVSSASHINRKIQELRPKIFKKKVRVKERSYYE